ncbi:Ig-like domain-containing protein, partial [Kangiella sp. HZ709]|uniref:Ig-like domain-containing protein n=1 Tax=Kangiella sp. HZ709 TaxID=2666328 RepID=UPI0012AF084F
NGTLTFNADGSYDYSPDANFNGTDSCTYIITDADGDTDIATVTITVTAVDDTPTATDDSNTVAEDGSITGASVAGNDTLGGDGGDLATAFSLDTDVSNGTMTFNADGSYDYSPDANFNGTDSFTYIITDADGDTDIA